MRPRLRRAVIAIALVPSLYCVIYLGAMWDPYGNVSRLPVGLANLDRGTEYRGAHHNLGEKLVEGLEEKRPFRFVRFDSAESAEGAVRSGEVYFALVVSEDFSGSAVPGAKTGALTLITSQGSSYVASIIGGRFAEDMAADVNRKIEIERWNAVLSSDLLKGLDAVRSVIREITRAPRPERPDAEHMAVSVQVRHEELAPVPSNGPAFAPYFMALSLWVGALMPAFLFRLTVLPRSAAGGGAAAKVAGKWAIPVCVSLAGALLLSVTIRYGMGIRSVHPAGLVAVLIAAALAYSATILPLVSLLGDVAKLLCVLLLVVQIASAGGAYPIELSPEPYRVVSHCLPLTHVVRGLRASMFGSFNGEWGRCVLFLILWAAGGALVGVVSARRFRYVEDEMYGPALSI
ncbi:MAG: YhgE/Pip family protein [bacterium]|nr:YhgE/Pip family protein [bacterium]